MYLKLDWYVSDTTTLPCAPEVAIDKITSNAANEIYRREYYTGLASKQSSDKMSLYSDPPPPFEDSVASEDTSLYGEVAALCIVYPCN